MNWLSSIAPAIATFIGGPAGLIAEAGVTFLADKLGAKDKTVDAIQDVLQGLAPSDRVKMKELDLDFQKFCLQNGIQIDLAQIAVNQVEAQSTNWFVAGWRPFVGWTCGLALAYVAIVEPISRFVAQVWFDYTGAFPVIDTTLTMQVLLGMLGLGAMRSVEKTKGAEGNR